METNGTTEDSQLSSNQDKVLVPKVPEYKAYTDSQEFKEVTVPELKLVLAKARLVAKKDCPETPMMTSNSGDKPQEQLSNALLKELTNILFKKATGQYTPFVFSEDMSEIRLFLERMVGDESFGLFEKAMVPEQHSSKMNELLSDRTKGAGRLMAVSKELTRLASRYQLSSGKARYLLGKELGEALEAKKGDYKRGSHFSDIEKKYNSVGPELEGTDLDLFGMLDARVPGFSAHLLGLPKPAYEDPAPDIVSPMVDAMLDEGHLKEDSLFFILVANLKNMDELALMAAAMLKEDISLLELKAFWTTVVGNAAKSPYLDSAIGNLEKILGKLDISTKPVGPKAITGMILFENSGEDVNHEHQVNDLSGGRKAFIEGAEVEVIEELLITQPQKSDGKEAK